MWLKNPVEVLILPPKTVWLSRGTRLEFVDSFPSGDVLVQFCFGNRWYDLYLDPSNISTEPITDREFSQYISNSNPNPHNFFADLF